MSSLTPMGINTMLGGRANIMKQSLPFTPTPKLIRKHYSDQESHDHHEEHHYSKKKKSRSIAMTALTLLSFLFFLHILQQCIHDQIDMTTTTPTTIIMQANIQAAKEGGQSIAKEGKQNLRESQRRANEYSSEEIEVTTPYASEEVPFSVEKSKERNNLYQYDKVHVPVKMKMVEKNHKIKKL